MKLPVKNSFWVNSFFITLIQRFSLFFFGLVGFFILTHYSFTNEQIGVYALFQTIISMMEYVKMGLLRNALIKFLYDGRYSGRLKEVQCASLLINVAFTLMLLFFFLLCSGWVAALLKTAELKSLLQLSVILVILLVPFNHCEIVQQGHMRFRITFIAYFLRQGILFLFIVSTLFIPETMVTIKNLVLAQIAAIFVASIYFLLASRQYLYSTFTYDREITLKLLQFGKFVFGTALFSHIYKFADHFVTAYAIGNPARGKVFVSYYSMVARVSNVLDMPLLAVSDVLFPKNAQAMATGGTVVVKYYFERMVGTLTALIIPVSLLILVVPKPIILIVAGPAYLPAVPVLQLTMLFAFLRPFFTQFGYTIDSIGKPQVNFIANFFFLIISLVCTFLGIRWFGELLGPVCATIFTLAIGCTIFYFILRDSLNIRVRNIIGYTLSTYKDIFLLTKKLILQRL